MLPLSRESRDVIRRTLGPCALATRPQRAPGTHRRGPQRVFFNTLGMDDRGQALIEFALASVVFFMTIFGTIEFGIAIWRYNMVSNLAQEGARWASVRGSTSSSPASAADVQTFVRSRTPGFTVTVTTTPAPSTVGPGGTVNVEVQTAYTPLTGLIPQATMNLRSRATMVVSR